VKAEVAINATPVIRRRALHIRGCAASRSPGIHTHTLMRMQALAGDRGGVPKLLIRNVRRSVATGGKPDIAQEARTGSD
jgi:hypothetical protein